jgi:hypothetical protein
MSFPDRLNNSLSAVVIYILVVFDFSAKASLLFCFTSMIFLAGLIIVYATATVATGLLNLRFSCSQINVLIVYGMNAAASPPTSISFTDNFLNSNSESSTLKVALVPESIL